MMWELIRTIRSPESGLVGQGVRYVLAGGTVAAVYLLTTLILAELIGLPFQVALGIGFFIGLLVHFSLQRLFVWIHHEEFALPLHHQAGRYLLVAGIQYGVTVASTSLLPSLLGIPVEIVYLTTAAVLVCANFLLFRYGIFYARSEARPAGPPQTVDEPQLLLQEEHPTE
jgi:putative flippase GtrA